MKKFLLLLLLPLTLFAARYNIVFVHIGPKLPDYLPTALEQAALFNPDCDLYLVGNESTLKMLKTKCKVNLVACESLKRDAIHKEFLGRSRLAGSAKVGFFQYASERFFYLYELMNDYKLTNVFHLESDVMLYADLSAMLSAFQKYYPGIGATFDNDDRCIPGFFYVQQKNALYDLAREMTKLAARGKNDMESIGLYRRFNDRSKIDSLPILPENYATLFPLENAYHKTTANPENYSNHFDFFQSVFDAAAIGQYLGGIDPIHGNSAPGFINELALFNPSNMTYIWKKDDKGRLVPYLVLDSAEYRINNLHVHCKNLKKFASVP